jgi:CRISPR-associated protein Cas2
MSFTVIITQNVPPRLRGRLAVFMVEARAGVYFTNLTRREREKLWEYITVDIEGGNVVLGWATNSESGFEFQTQGANRRIAVNWDGLMMVNFANEAGESS